MFLKLTNTQQGIIWMLLSAACFTLMSLAVKQLSSDMDSGFLLLFRSLFTVICILISIFFVHKLRVKKGGRPWLLCYRGVIGSLAVLLVFYCISISNLATAATFLQTTPLFVASMAFFVLKEQVSIHKSLTIIAGFIGILCITKQLSFSVETMLVGCSIGLLAALAYTSVKKLTDYYESRLIVLSFAISGLGLGLLLIILSGLGLIAPEGAFKFLYTGIVIPNYQQWFLLVVIGLFATLTQLFLTYAYSLAPASIISTIGYSSIPFALLCDVIVYSDQFTALNLLGIILVAISSLSIARSK